MKNFIQRLCEAEINQTEVALATSSVSEQIQSMIEKLSNIKVKDVAELSKKIKYDGDIEAGDSLNNSLGSKLDQAIQSLTDIKSDIDNQVVKISQGDLSGSTDSDGLDDSGELGSFEDDFGSDIDEFSADEDQGDEDLDLSDMNDAEFKRERK
jgi:hypothetical protein